jgi:hypothetical protein
MSDGVDAVRANRRMFFEALLDQRNPARHHQAVEFIAANALSPDGRLRFFPKAIADAV